MVKCRNLLIIVFELQLWNVPWHFVEKNKRIISKYQLDEKCEDNYTPGNFCNKRHFEMLHNKPDIIWFEILFEGFSKLKHLITVKHKV